MTHFDIHSSYEPMCCAVADLLREKRVFWERPLYLSRSIDAVALVVVSLLLELGVDE